MERLMNKYGRLVVAIALSLLVIIPVRGDEVGDGDSEGNVDESVEQFASVRSEFIILFMFVGILLGTFSTHLLSRIALPIPYTVLMYLEGLFLALFMQKVHIGRFGQAVEVWGDINPDLLLYSFLPILLFGEAMSLNWNQVRATFWQCFVLAIPGVVLSTLLTAGFTMLVLPAWSWQLCFVFGSIMSATDPVAVVSILKSAGASPKLTTLIIGESLMNDGTAMIFFSLFFGMVEGHNYSAGQIAAYMFQMTLGSPLVGIAIGLVFVFMTGKANKQLNADDVTVQISLTICCAYVVFFIAQITFQISGVLACCGAGLMFAWLAPPLILKPDTMHSVWAMLEWTANTLLFLLAGLIIGSDVLHNMNWIDCLYVVMFYAVIQLIRLVVVFVFHPLLSRAGQKFTIYEALFMSWAGLRGAMSICLALLVKENKQGRVEGMEADRLFFYVGGVATLTLVINATTTKAVLKLLGIVRDTSDDGDNAKLVTDLIRMGIRRKMRMKMAELLEAGPISSSNDVISYISLLVDEEREIDSFANGTASSTHERRREELNDFADRGHVCAPIRDVLFHVRAVFLGIVRIEYWNCIESGKMPREAPYTNDLLFSIDYALERVNEGNLQDWKSLCNDMEISPVTYAVLDSIDSIENAFCRRFDFRGLFIGRKEEMKAYVLTTFIEAHENAQTRICNFMGRPDDSSSITAEEQVVISESVQLVSEARKMLQLIDENVVASIRCKQAARSLLKHQTDLILGMKQEALLSPSDASVFLDSISNDMTRVDHETKKQLKIQRRKARSDGIDPIESRNHALKSGLTELKNRMSGNGDSTKKRELLKQDDLLARSSLMLDSSSHSSSSIGI